MRRVITQAGLSLVLVLLFASPAHAAFGVSQFDLTFLGENGLPTTQAGWHPGSAVTDLRFNSKPDPAIGELPDGAVRNVEVSLPEGLVGKPNAVPRCSQADFVNILTIPGVAPVSNCPAGSQVGIALNKGFFNKFFNESPPPKPLYSSSPVFNLEPGPGSVLKLGFFVLRLVPIIIEFTVSQNRPYRVIAKVSDISQLVPIYGTKLAIWGNPASHSHDGQRMTCVQTFAPIDEERFNTVEGCAIPANVEEAAFVTLPTSCTNPLSTGYFLSSWEGEASEGVDPGQTLTGCESLDFEPAISAQPTAGSSQTSSGLDFTLDVEDEGLSNPGGRAQSDIRRTEVTLPEGMTVNPSVASGLAACSAGDLQRETLDAAPGQGCPQSSKIGSVEVETPLLDESLEGSLYAAKPFENEVGSLLAIYLVIKNQNLGVIIKQTIKVLPNGENGQLTAIADDVPQLPFSHFRLNFRGGERGPLTTPSGCGRYDAKAVLTPWSGGAPVTSTGMFQITTGCGGSSFAPSFEAGTLTPLAGTKSPFVLNLSRAPGSPRLASIEATLPEGLLGKLAGVKECSEAQIAAAAARSAPNQGALELAERSCPRAPSSGRSRSVQARARRPTCKARLTSPDPIRGRLSPS